MPITRVAQVPFLPRHDHVYQFLRGRGSAGLFVDVGAASGEISLRIAQDAAQVVAFEPFPNNAKLFRKRLKNCPRVSLVEKAVSNRRGRTTFFVDSTVQGDEKGWSDQVGYSSLGRIPTTFLGTMKSYALVGMAALRRRRGATILRVDTTTLDFELGEKVIDFLKVDVQGAERRVLEGAKAALGSQRIRLIYIEWFGDPVVERRLEDAGYSLFDSMYIGSGSPKARSEFECNGFEVIGSVPLSIGQPALEMVYRGTDPDIGLILRNLNNRGHFIQTDLVGLPEKDAPEFLEFLRASQL